MKLLEESSGTGLLRILAHCSGDQQLIDAYRNQKDIHRITASQVFHVPFAVAANVGHKPVGIGRFQLCVLPVFQYLINKRIIGRELLQDAGRRRIPCLRLLPSRDLKRLKKGRVYLPGCGLLADRASDPGSLLRRSAADRRVQEPEGHPPPGILSVSKRMIPNCFGEFMLNSSPACA